MTRITAGPSHSSRIAAVEPGPADAELLAKVGEIIADLSPDNGSLLTAFHRIQHAYGYVPGETIPLLASKFRTTPAMLFGALGFYSEIRTVPPAETTIEWCSGPACLLKGSTNIQRVLEAILGCEMGENSTDGAFGLRLVQCDGTCHLAPLVRLHEKYVGPLSVSDAIKLARELRGNGRSKTSEEDAQASSGEADEAREGEET